MKIVKQYGTMWARNTKNIARVPGTHDGGQGVYVLFDGSMPIYVGKGNIRFQLNRARRSRRRKELWDRFSWYILTDQKMMHDVEVLLLRVLPKYLRALTRQDGHFLGVKHGTRQTDAIADPIKRRWNKKAKS